MKSSLFALTALAMTAGVAQAEMMPDAVTEPVTITFYNYNLSSAGNGADATRKMIAEFEALNPNIKVKGVPVAPQDLATRIQADIVAGQPVDLSQMTFAALGFATENLGAQPLEDIVPAAELSAHFTGMVPNGLELGRLGGKTYGLAYTFSTPVLFYNADLFKKAGLDPNTPPTTWAELKEMGLQIKEKTDALPLATGIYGPTALDWLAGCCSLERGRSDQCRPDRDALCLARKHRGRDHAARSGTDRHYEKPEHHRPNGRRGRRQYRDVSAILGHSGVSAERGQRQF